MEHHGSLLSVGANLSGPSFNDLELLVKVIHSPPYLIVHDHPNGSITFSGYLHDIWRIVARELELRYRIEPLRTGGYGSHDEDGNWNGLVGELAYRRADVGLSWLYLRQDREEVINYIDTVPVEHTLYTFYVRQGSGGIPHLSLGMFNTLLKPLHVHVWWMLLASLLVISVVLRFSLSCNRRVERKETVHEMTWGSCLLSSFMTVVGQSWEVIPDSLAARTVTAFSWVLGILIYFNYTANLISYLTVVTVDKPIHSLKEFTEHSNWRLAIEPGIAELNDWKISKSPYERELYRRSVLNDKFISLDISDQTAVAEAVKPNVLTYIDIKRIFISHGSEACSLVPLLETPPAKNPTYIIIAKDREEIRHAINRMMLKMKQAGTLDRLKSKWLPVVEDMCEKSAGVKELSFGDLLAVLVVVPLAVVISGAIFIGELAWHWLHGRCQTSNADREHSVASVSAKN